MYLPSHPSFPPPQPTLDLLLAHTFQEQRLLVCLCVCVFFFASVCCYYRLSSSSSVKILPIYSAILPVSLLSLFQCPYFKKKLTEHSHPPILLTTRFPVNCLLFPPSSSPAPLVFFWLPTCTTRARPGRGRRRRGTGVCACVCAHDANVFPRHPSPEGGPPPGVLGRAAGVAVAVCALCPPVLRVLGRLGLRGVLAATVGHARL